MEYRVMGTDIALRLDPKEEICQCILEVCRKEQVPSAFLTGLGAVDYAVTGLYHLDSREFLPTVWEKEMELVSLIGNASWQEGEPYLHLHASFADAQGNLFGGHLKEARVSATAEIFLHVLPQKLGRRLDEEVTGLNLLQF